jgi:Tol biopolymer transport system component
MFRPLATATAVLLSLFMLLILGVLLWGWGQPRHVLAYTNGIEQGFSQGIQLMDVDRRFAIPLTAPMGGVPLELQWSPDGQQLLFLIVGNTDISTAIYVVALSDLNVKNLSYRGDIISGPSWSPDSRLLALSVKTPQGDFELQVIDVKSGETLDYLTQPTDFSYYSPAWSPDGQMLAFESEAELRIIDVKNGQAISDLIPSNLGRYPVSWQWSPDSRWLVFASTYDNEYLTLSVIDLSNRRLRHLSSSLYFESAPTIWSPDSKFIVFSSDEVTNNGSNSAEVLHVMNIADGHDEIITPQGSGQTIWSPDGKWLAFADIEQHVLFDISRSDNQIWLPDGEILIFGGQSSGKYGLFILDVKSNPISHLVDNVASAAWQP